LAASPPPRPTDQAGIALASATFEIVGLPPLRIDREPRTGVRGAGAAG